MNWHHFFFSKSNQLTLFQKKYINTLCVKYARFQLLVTTEMWANVGRGSAFNFLEGLVVTTDAE